MKKIFLIVLLIPLVAFNAHKFYISLIKVEFKAEKETVQITMRIFIDDMQKVINKSNNIDIELGVKDELKKSNELIYNYIKENFEVKINSKNSTYTYVGKEYDNDVIYIYLELNNIKSIDTVEISDTMLMDYFSSQQNIVKLNINKVKKTFVLTKDEDSDLFKF